MLLAKAEDCSVFTGPRCLWGPVYGSRCLYLPPYKTFGWDFADVTLADDDTNSMLADDAYRAIWGKGGKGGYQGGEEGLKC